MTPKGPKAGHVNNVTAGGTRTDIENARTPYTGFLPRLLMRTSENTVGTLLLWRREARRKVGFLAALFPIGNSVWGVDSLAPKSNP